MNNDNHYLFLFKGHKTHKVNWKTPTPYLKIAKIVGLIAVLGFTALNIYWAACFAFIRPAPNGEIEMTAEASPDNSNITFGFSIPFRITNDGKLFGQNISWDITDAFISFEIVINLTINNTATNELTEFKVIYLNPEVTDITIPRSSYADVVLTYNYILSFEEFYTDLLETLFGSFSEFQDLLTLGDLELQPKLERFTISLGATIGLSSLNISLSLTQENAGIFGGV